MISTFEGNSGSGGAAINLAYYNARFDNVNFTNNIGSTLRVSMIMIHAAIYAYPYSQLNT